MPPLQTDDPLQTPVQYVRGAGPVRAELLARMGIRTVADLLWQLPRDVLDLSAVRSPDELTESEWQTIRGVISDVDARVTGGGKPVVAALVDCGAEYVRGIWFQQPWMRQKLVPGQTVLFSGKPKRRQGRWEFAHPLVQWLESDDTDSQGDPSLLAVLPRYPLTEGLPMAEMRRMTRNAVEQFAPYIADPLPESFRESLRLPVLREAIQHLHVPTSRESYEQGRHRVLFDDLFEFQLAIALRRRAWRTLQQAPVLEATAKIDARIRRLFPFPFTAGQDAAVAEITADLRSGRAMHRLIQADVGAGKTVLAIYAMLVAVAHGYQAVLMAPTELLALQHAETIESVLGESQVRRRLLTGSLTAGQRREALTAISEGTADLIVGTQALIQRDVRFARLGVIVIDEQHRFGVAQRALLSAGDGTPHVLVMTATPIPRSLCLTQFGDLDLTVMTELPPGRQPVVTSRISGEPSRRKVWEFLKRQLQAGRQAYVVCPRVEGESEDRSAIRGADLVFERVQSALAGEFAVGLVHGQMDRRERADVMDRFRAGNVRVLVSTTVIEVGVDVPNATLMVVLDAERFGLSQLHQLRGRVGRGLYRGYCFLFSESTAPEAVRRLHALEETADGFRIAEADFALRGPGDVLGTRQHGELPFRVADLPRDAALLEEARREALALVESGRFDGPEFAPLKLAVLDRFGQLMDLPPSG